MTFRLGIEKLLLALPQRPLLALLVVFAIGGSSWAISDRGFARAHRVATIETRTLERDLIDTLTAKCAAGRSTFLSDRLEQLRREYQVLTGREWMPPGCAELGQ